MEGKFTLDGHVVCHNCPAGRFHNETGAAISLTDSLPRTHASHRIHLTFSTGVPYCYICPAGKYAEPGAPKCTECEYEKFQPTADQGSCVHCEMGKFQHIRGRTECRGAWCAIFLAIAVAD
jgi:hypothetical protein